MSELTDDTVVTDLDTDLYTDSEDLDLDDQPEPSLDLGMSTTALRNGEQWRAERLQLCNWGGFDGPHEIDIDWETTLLTGGSGTGKSTIGDAWLALVQPGATHFNAASNPSKSRARGEGSRSNISYVRGHLDRKTTESGTKEIRKLRGANGAVWGGIAMTFLSTSGRRFTALKLMHIPPSARVDSDAPPKMFTIDGPVDLERLAAAAPERFNAIAVKSLLPGAHAHKKPGQFQDTIAAKLGIGGADANGAKYALRMLERIQSGEQVRNINDLFTKFVLDAPKTLSDADKALVEWDKLEEAMEVLDLNRRKFEVLRDIRDLHAKVEAAQGDQRTFKDLGLDSESSPWALWCAREEECALDSAWDANRERRTALEEDLAAARAAEKSTKVAHDNARRALDEYTRGELGTLRGNHDRAEAALADTMTRRSALAARIAPLGTLPDDETGFESMRLQAQTEREAFPAAKKKFDDDKYAAISDKRNMEAAVETLRQDKASFGSRQGRVDPDMDMVRNQAAQIARMDPADLPYGAELIDIAEGQEEWREAIETILWPVSSCVLINEEKLEEFSKAVDDAGLRGRINFEGVPLFEMSQARPDADRVGGKLVFKDSPFEGWLRDRLAKPDLNALCVRTPEELRSPDRTEVRVTLAGQTRRGKRGSAGKRNRRAIIGFSNELDLAAIDLEIAELEPLIEKAAARFDVLDTEQNRLMRRYEAAGALLHEDWANLDAVAAEAKRDALAKMLSEATAGDSKLAGLQHEAQTTEAEYFTARDLRREVEKDQESVEEDREKIRRRKDNAVTPRLERLDKAGLEVTEAQDELLRRFARGLDDHWSLMPKAHADLRQKLVAEQRAVNASASEHEMALLGCFRHYLTQWGENHPSLEADLRCYPDFVAILEEIESYGLHQAEARFRKDLAHWSGQQLLRLHNAFDTSWDDITSRMYSINKLLEDLPFGVRHERLDIRVDRAQPAEVTDFRRDLKALATRRTEELEQSEVMPYFRLARELLAKIRKPEDARYKAVQGAPSRAALLDVRKHLNIEADRIDATGAVGGTYDTLGTQSGGESQELLAFILGAALRYQLGDSTSNRPSFAFVVLDEAFVKADPEFAGRSMEAWQKLGFQLLVAAPVDKFTALEPLAQRFLLTEKEEDERSYVTPIDREEAICYAEAAAERGDHISKHNEDFDPDEDSDA